VQALNAKRPTWKSVLEKHRFLALPVAHDALTARLIEQAGFPAYQIGGFALAATLHAVPDIDLEHFGEISKMVEKIIPASNLPALVDCDDGYGDEKNVSWTVEGYERLNASALFIEDQQAPKRCGHMADKKVVPVEEMVKKVRAAVGARSSPDLFIVARTDAIAPHGLEDALMRAEQYLKAGADGVYFEGPTSEEQLEAIGKQFGSVPLATSVLERGGVTPALSQDRFKELGFSMVLYPSTVIFQAAHCIQGALENLLANREMSSETSVNMDEFEAILNMPKWKKIEESY
jgi:2-methylisocitrate lyase-like PEP mutase family enzyme